jgi:hypothetical protein
MRPIGPFTIEQDARRNLRGASASADPDQIRGHLLPDRGIGLVASLTDVL